MSPITTHILNTSLGKPAAGVRIILYQQNGKDWNFLAEGITNSDGRVADLLPEEKLSVPANFKLRFETNAYFQQLGIESFYPFIEIVFTIKNNEHYHVPLLLNPFGYSTYRGS